MENKKDLEDKTEDVTIIEQKNKPKFNETSRMMTIKAQCEGYGPYSPMFANPQEYFNLLGIIS